MLIALIIGLWLLIQTSFFQTFLVRQVAGSISHNLGAKVSIRHVNFELFNSMLLEGTLVLDKKKDTLLYAGAVKVNITDWFFFKDNIELKYIGLKDAVIKLNRTDSVWNYQFITDYFSGPPSAKKQNTIHLDLKQIELGNIYLQQKDGWRGEDMTGSVKSLSISADQIDLNKKLISIHNIDMEAPYFAVFEYDGNRPPLPQDTTEEQIINDPAHLRWNPGGWDLSIKSININKGIFRSDSQTDRQPYTTFDGAHILFGDITGSFKNCRLANDTLTATVLLKTKERCGFRVDQLSAQMKMHPEAMEFSKLDIRTADSRLHDYFSMRYTSFDDMSHFISRVKMEGHFNGAVISSDDIAYFAPELKDWKKRFVAEGIIKGTVDNLNGKKLIIEEGKDTYLKGNIRMAGLPDINKTYIDFEAENFRTSYKDAVSFIPQLKDVSQPRLDLLEYLEFQGNFTGFFNDFVTYGSLETRLGTVITDLNMKLPGNQPSKYSGNIKTTGFNLGKLLDNRTLGNIVFQGNVNGSGLHGSTVNAKLDGNIDLLEFNNYPYKGITVKGNVAKQLFNGELVAADPNLQAQLDGLVDFSKKIPEFNFDANITKADLKKLNLMKDDIEFDGKFRFNFKGNNIDNFLGTARIYDASLFKSGKRISFDSLYIESKILDSNKVITAVSNEFDAALAGEFSIKDLPTAFQTFLNKYYPAYIKPSKKILTNENFSFVITTKKVDEYINIIDPDLSGFNFSTLTGRINTRENLLDLNAEVPQFNYKNLAFYDVKMRATGAYDSLSLETEIANVYINDSLNFPATVIKLKSAKDISDVNIHTSANQTLNSADIIAQVQTLPKGAKIKFRESNFDVNGKTWTIEKNGELLFTEDIISATGIKLYNGLQEIHVTSAPNPSNSKINDLKVDMKKVNIGDFTPYLVKTNRIEGLLSGTINLTDPFGKLKVDLNADAEQFRLDNDSIGKIALKGNYYKIFNEANFNAVSDNKDYKFDMKGIYNLGDSTKEENIDIFTNLHDTKIDILQTYLSGVFSNVTGLVTGVLRIKGPAKNLNYVGSVHLMDASLKVKYTNVVYRIADANIELKEDRIDFGSFSFVDKNNNKAQITRGILYHQSFNNLSFDFAMNTPKLLVLATNNSGGDPYYGTVIAKANMTFRGPLEDMQMDIDAEPADSSSLIINTKSGKESGQADFVVWKVYGREMQSVKPFNENNLTVNLNVTANNYANMYVILDELTGDVIKATGKGNLKIRATTDGEFTITGRYDIDRGNYNFNFESLLKKPFRLREDGTNYIQWSGDPEKATIKIDAEYEAENVRFSDLGSSLTLIPSLTDNITKYRGKVLVIASLSDQLLSPAIKFRIELPSNSPIKNDEGTARVLDAIQKDENELNKQVAFLVVFNSFGPLSTSQNQGNIANNAFEGIVVGSISGVLSNTLSQQFSNAFQKFFKDKSIKVNFNAQLYNGTNLLAGGLIANTSAFNIDRTNLNLSVGKSLFNERLTFTFGSAVDFGLSSTQASATKNLPFLPDVTAEWKITPDGKLALTFFYRDSYNFLANPGASNGSAKQNRTGASISYRREFETFGEIMESKKKKK
ncbi:MAG: translocation/assembly module TamB domain-containing protein [Chitinophagaceae bacterium]|nr:translocation/assembly module TamB domain-containing protein [Chitinophagaceae bacterium]